MSKASMQKLYREGRELYVRDEAGLIRATCSTHEVATATAMGEGLEEIFYTYEGVPEKNRQEIDKLVAGLKTKLGEQITRTASIGADLLKAKALLGKRGKFGIWLQSEFRLSVRTAQHYMSVAKRFPDLNATVADNLSPSAAYALAAKSTSREVGDEFIKRAAAGENISGKKVKARRAAGNQAPEKTEPKKLKAHAKRVARKYELKDLKQFYEYVGQEISELECAARRIEYLPVPSVTRVIKRIEYRP